MLARVIALVLAVVMMTGAAAQVWASPDVASAAAGVVGGEIDDGPGLEPAILPEPVAVPLPDRGEPVMTRAPGRAATGRLHAVFVFRPPRPVASR